MGRKTVTFDSLISISRLTILTRSTQRASTQKSSIVLTSMLTTSELMVSMMTMLPSGTIAGMSSLAWS